MPAGTLLEPLLKLCSALKPLAGTLLGPPFHRWNPLPGDPSSGPFQHPSGSLLADPSSAKTPSSTPSIDRVAPHPKHKFCLRV